MIGLRRPGAAIGFFFLILVSLPSQDQAIPLDPPPGTYGTGVELRLPDDEILEYRFIGTDGTPHTDFFLPFDSALRLDAPDGGEARYSIELSWGTNHEIVEYRIDLRPPSAPIPDPAPDMYTSDQSVLASSDEDATIFVLSEDGRFVPVDNENPIHIAGERGEIVDRSVVLYAEDAVGNRSETRSYTYRIDRRDERPAPERIILSPAVGDFANEQLLLLDTIGLREVSYAITGARSESAPYTAPRIVRGDGDFSLEVTGTEIITGRVRTERVEWTQRTGPELSGFPESGIVTDDLVIDPPSDALRYTLQDRPVRSIDPVQRDPLTLRVTTDARRTVVLRRGSDRSRDERYVVVLDGRRPPPPNAIILEDSLRLIGLADTEIAFVAGAREGEPDSASIYEEPIQLTQGAEMALVAWSRYNGGAWSAPLSTSVQGPPADNPVGMANLTWDGTTVTLRVPRGYRFRIPELSPLDVISTGVVRYRPPRGFDRSLVVEGGGTEVAIEVDTAPPAPPTIESRGARVTISGDGELFYRIDGGAFVPYQGELTLPGEVGVRIDYRVDAYRLIAGEQSTIARTIVPVDRRPLALPPLIEPVDGAILNEGELHLQFAGSYEDLQIHYELSYQGTPRIPTDSSPSTFSSIRVTTPEGEVRQWQLAVRGRFVGRQGWTPVSTMSFVVDRVPPEAPVLIRPTMPVAETERFIVEFDDTEEDTRLFYRLEDQQLFIPYDGPVSVNVPESGARTYRIDAYTVDPAGNRTSIVEPLVATLTSSRPDAPIYAVNGRTIRNTGVALNREAILSLETDATGDQEVFWRIIDDTDGDFVPYDEPYRLRMPEEGEERTVRAEAYRETGDGLRSPVSRVTVVLDRSAPVEPPAPFVHRNENGRSGFLIWPGGETNQVFVALDEASEEVFIPTDGRVSWSIPPDRESLRVTYFTIDDAGNRSESGSLTIRQPEAVYIPEVFGVEDEGIYRSERTVELRSDLPVRYTVTLDGTSPPPVHPLSALYQEPLRFTASTNDEVTVRLRYRSQNNEGTLSDEGSVTFTIDRQVPKPPTITGVSPDAYYPDARRATISSPEGDRIFYRAFRGDDSDNDFREYRGETIDLPAVEGSLARYHIEAYTVDSAGNRSEATERWTIHIDREIVYVAANAQSGGAGTRSAPYQDLGDAFTTASEEGRSTIFLAAGMYEISNEMLRTAASEIDNLAIIGGFSSDTWSENAGVTVIEAPNGSIELFGELRVRTVTIAGGLLVKPGAAVEMQNVLLRGGTDAPTVIDGGATALLRECRVQGPLVIRDGASASAYSSRTDAIYVDGGSLSMNNGDSGPIFGDGASVVLGSSRLTVPRSHPIPPDLASSLPNVNTAALLVFRDSTLRIEDSLLDSSSDHANTTILSVERSSTTVLGSTVRAQAEGAALAIRQRGGDVHLGDSRLVSVGGRYSYAAAIRGGSLTLYNTVVLLEGGDELVGVIANGGTAAVVHSMVEVKPVPTSRIIQGLTFDGSSGCFVFNSIITVELGATVPESVSTGLSLDRDANASIYGSLFAGWTRDLVQSAGPMQWSTRDAVLSAARFSTGSFGDGNVSAGGFPTDLRSPLLVEMDTSSLADALLNTDLSLLADGGVSPSRLPREILDRLGGETPLDEDFRGVRRSRNTPDIGPMEF